jgi:putative transposase
MIRDYQTIAKTWFEKGRQRIIPTYGQHKGVKLLGVLNYETGHVYCKEEEQYDALAFKDFVEDILRLYPTGKIVMVLDNARIHHAKLLKPLLEENEERLQLVFLPPYSPKLNLVEGLWKWLKQAVICNVFFPAVEAIREAVQGFLSSINKVPMQVIDRLCLRM